MKTKYLFFAALAGLTLASCADDVYVGENSPNVAQEKVSTVSFGFKLPNATRADLVGAAAATALNNQFIVWGEKNEAADGSAASNANLVFKNYQVNYEANTAFTTQSNTENWEYVGFTHSNTASTDDYQTNITPSLNLAQTIKYWDFTATSYTYTAVSAKQDDIKTGKVRITKVTSGSDVYKKGYTLSLTADADPSKVYIADREVIEKGTPASEPDRTADNTYGGNVTLKFRNILSHVRVGMFETVPGYDVKIDKFYYKSDGTPSTFSDMTGSNSTTNFVANVANVATSSAATLTVTYLDNSANNSAAENQPTIAIADQTISTHLQLGTNILGTTLGTTAPTAIFDTDGVNIYSDVFPQEANTTPLKLMIDYTLTSPTGETIKVSQATAEIPANYLQWKPNYKYTYLFKISEDSNGSTGDPTTDPKGLYPITFDACVVVAEDGLAEYITTVSEPSITTFGVLGGKYSIGKNEYDALTAVYATVEDGSSLATLSASNMQLYTVTSTSPYLVTEAAVAEALIEKPAMTKAQVDLAKIQFPTNPALTYQNTVPAEDGTTKTLHATDKKAATFNIAASTKYALVYEKTAATYVWGTGSKYATQAAFDEAAANAVDGKLYTDDQCTTPATWADADTEYYTANAAKYPADGDFTNAGNVYAAPGSVATPADSRANDSTPYYKPIKVKSKGTYAIKVINAQ